MSDAAADHSAIEVLAGEGGSYPPPENFAAQALIADDSLHREAAADLDAFWLRRARETTRRGSRSPRRAWSGSAALHLVRRRRPQRQPFVPRPPHRGRQRRPRSPTTSSPRTRPRRPRPGATPTCTPRSAGWRTRSAAFGVGKGDRVGIYMGMVPADRRRDARLRPDRRATRRRLRRLLARLARRPARRFGRDS